MEDTDTPLEPSEQRGTDEEGSTATTNACEAEALRYLREHKIPQLFEQLTAALVYARPDDPKAFMREHVRELQRARQNPEEDPPCFLDESNLRSVFGMLDVSGRGHVSLQQYRAAMESMGVGQFNASPAGAELDKIGRDTFVREAKAAVKAASATFLDY